MMNRRFQLIDVFGEHLYSGNPLPVIIDGEGLSKEAMQNITRWMNHSETTFLLPPSNNEADYREPGSVRGQFRSYLDHAGRRRHGLGWWQHRYICGRTGKNSARLMQARLWKDR